MIPHGSKVFSTENIDVADAVARGGVLSACGRQVWMPPGDHVGDGTDMVDRAPCDSCGGGPDVAAIGTDPAAAEAFLRGDA